jgi:hypothetical protein
MRGNRLQRTGRFRSASRRPASFAATLGDAAASRSRSFAMSAAACEVPALGSFSARASLAGLEADPDLDLLRAEAVGHPGLESLHLRHRRADAVRARDGDLSACLEPREEAARVAHGVVVRADDDQLDAVTLAERTNDLLDVPVGAGPLARIFVLRVADVDEHDHVGLVASSDAFDERREGVEASSVGKNAGPSSRARDQLGHEDVIHVVAHASNDNCAAFRLQAARLSAVRFAAGEQVVVLGVGDPERRGSHAAADFGREDAQHRADGNEDRVGQAEDLHD